MRYLIEGEKINEVLKLMIGISSIKYQAKYEPPTQETLNPLQEDKKPFGVYVSDEFDRFQKGKWPFAKKAIDLREDIYAGNFGWIEFKYDREKVVVAHLEDGYVIGRFFPTDGEHVGFEFKDVYLDPHQRWYVGIMQQVLRAYEAPPNYRTLVENYFRDLGTAEKEIQNFLDLDPLGLFEDETPSHNRNFIIRGEKDFLRVKKHMGSPTRTPLRKAELEGRGNYYFGLDPVLSWLVSGSSSKEVLDLGKFALSVQYDKKRFMVPGNLSLRWHLDVLAKFSARAELYREELGFGPGGRIFLNDEKPENTIYIKEEGYEGGKKIDLERLCQGEIAQALPQWFAHFGLDKEGEKKACDFLASRLALHSGGSIVDSGERIFHAYLEVSEKILKKEIRALRDRPATRYTPDLLKSLIAKLKGG